MDAHRGSFATGTQPLNITRQIHALSSHPVGFGGFSDIYRGIWYSVEGEVEVALKVLRVRTMDMDSEKLMRQLLREISVWKRLSHPNIHMLCGLYDGIGPAPAMVSPWCKNGDIINYIAKRQADPEVDLVRLRLFAEVMAGLEFLHGRAIVHGDIKGGNVLISDDGVARLCDFGLSRLLVAHSQSISQSVGKGTLRWMAPELALEEEVRSYASDIWASGCLLIEIWTGQPPYPSTYNDVRILVSLSQREGPTRPSAMTDFPARLLQDCCKFNPDSRPAPVQVAARVSIHLVMPRLALLVTEGNPPEDGDAAFLREIETSLEAAEVHETAHLYAMNTPDLVTAVVRILSLWGLNTRPVARMYPDELYLYCLDVVGRGPQLPASTSYSSGEDAGGIPPSTLRPIVRLLAVDDPIRGQRVMSKFTRVSIPNSIVCEGRSAGALFPSASSTAMMEHASLDDIPIRPSFPRQHRLISLISALGIDSNPLKYENHSSEASSSRNLLSTMLEDDSPDGIPRTSPRQGRVAFSPPALDIAFNQPSPYTLPTIAVTPQNASRARTVHFADDPIGPSPPPRRVGWFNRKGDQLWTNAGGFVAARPGEEYPRDLELYPDPGEGWQNEQGQCINMRHQIVPKAPRSALKPYRDGNAFAPS